LGALIRSLIGSGDHLWLVLLLYLLMFQLY
jgi:hypothetical protein